MLKNKFFCVAISLLIATFSAFASNNNHIKVNKSLPFSKGLNLSTWLESFGFPKSSTTYFSKQDFINIKSLGVEVIRIPIHFEQFSSKKPDYIIQSWLWEYIDNAINWCEELEMYVILDFHNLTAEGTTTPSNVEKMLLKIWEQIATRYKDKSDYVIYEILNEPHGIDIAKWGRVQGKVIKLIRSIDKKHFIIVSGADYNSIPALLKLPNYKDDKLIYNFHDYSPFLFTHQGASWTTTKNLKGIPFPYNKEKMPKFPKRFSSHEKWLYDNYEEASKLNKDNQLINEAIKFANKRKAPLMCNEFGVYIPYADKQERLNWYEHKINQYDKANITRISWDYIGGFGIFNNTGIGVFPDDLNLELIDIMGYKRPNQKNISYNNTWFVNAKKTNNYTIYSNKLSDYIIMKSWIKDDADKCDLYKVDEESKENYIYLDKLKDYDFIEFHFIKPCDFTSLVKSGACLEFEVKATDPKFKFEIFFKNSAQSKYEWRMGSFFNERQFIPDGKWHKISVPLSKFIDIGAWDNTTDKWIPSQSLYDWKDTISLTFAVQDCAIKKGLGLKNIRIK